MQKSYDADLSLFIGGSWKIGEGRDLFPVVDPASGEAIGEVPMASAADLDEALDAADKGFKLWRDTPADQRGAVLKKAAVLLRERVEPIARLLTLEQGKPLPEARAEVLSSAQLFDWCGEEATRIYGRTLVRPTGQRSLITRQPIGPVAAFSPWNFPVYLMAKKLAPALATGCSVIAKPPEETPGCTGALVRCLVDAGVPAGVVQLVHGVPDAVSRHLLASPVIRKVSFTGSVPVGRHLMRLAADGLKRVTMELGGHAAAIVFEDADIDAAARALAGAKFRNGGQVCVSPTRFLVQESVHARFVDSFVAAAGAIKVGDGLDPATRMGPLANPRRVEAMLGFVDDAVGHGAKLALGGKRIGSIGNFFEPTVLTEVPAQARILSEEPFGPIAPIASFKTFDEAVAEANRLPFGLAAYAFTRSLKTATAIAAALEAGMVSINHFGLALPEVPFGGMKDSGYGSEGGSEAIEAYLNTKFVTQIGI